MVLEYTSGVLRRHGRLPPSSFRYYPFDTGTSSGLKEDMKQEVIRLGVDLSLYMSETMFLLSDDIHTMLCFCTKLWRCLLPYKNPVLQRLLRVMHFVYTDYIKPSNNGVFQDVGSNSVQWEFVSTTWDDFVTGILVMHRLVLVLGRNDYSFDDRLLSSAIAKYKQVLKKLEDKLRSARDVSEANGFARETIEPRISHLWNSLFHEEPKEATSTLKLIRSSMVRDMFTSIFDKPFHSEILALPPHPPYILGTDFAKQELKEEVVQLGVELSLCVAQSMFLLCDDIHSVLWFCYKLWGDAQRDDRNPDSPVVERLLCVIHYVYSKYIVPKNGVYQNDDGKSVQWGLISETWKDFDVGIRDLDRLVLSLRGEGNCLDGRELTSSIEEALKKVDEKLRSVKDISEANGFAREAIESSVLESWKSLFDKEAKKVMRNEMLGDLFLPVCFKAPPC